MAKPMTSREVVTRTVESGRPEGGFIPKWHGDPKGAGHAQEAIEVMCREFLKLSREIYGA